MSTPAPRIPVANALKLSAWIATQHPELFRQLLTKVQALQRSPLGRLGFFGDDEDLFFTPDLPAIQIAPDIDYESTAAYTPDLTDISFDVNAATGSAPGNFDFSDSLNSAIAAPSPGVSTDTTSSGFWSSIGSGAASVASAVGKVASALVSPQSIAAVGGAAAAYFAAQGKSAQTSAQNAVLQAQLARTAVGVAPAPISYVTNPATGQLVPVYNTASGQIPVTGSMLNSLSSPAVAGTVAGIPTTYVLIGGGLLVLAVLFSGRNTAR